MRVLHSPLIALLAGLCTLLSSQALADCNVHTRFAETDGLMPYRILVESFDQLPGVSRDEGVAAVIAAADTWNEQAASGHFRYNGDHFGAFPPEWDNACQGAQSVVYVDNQCVDAQWSDDYVSLQPRCKNSFDIPRYRGAVFEMAIHSRRRNADGQCEPIPWSLGERGAGNIDLVAMLVHHFGHTLNLGEDLGVMLPLARGRDGSIKDRDLPEYSMNCSTVVGGWRRVGEWHIFNHDGVLNPELQSYSDNGLGKQFAPGVTPVTGSWRWTSARWLLQTIHWYFDLGTKTQLTLKELQVPRAMTNAVFREEPSTTRVLVSAGDEHHAQIYWWGDDYATQHAALDFCRAMDGPTQCWQGSPTPYPLLTTKPVAVAWNDQINRSVFAWVADGEEEKPRPSSPWLEHNRLLVAIGYLDDTTLGVPDPLPARSVVAPGVACKAGAAAGYDCVLAYVDDRDSLFQVRTLRFEARYSESKQRYFTIYDKSPPSLVDPDARTATRIALWYHEGQFWIALRSMLPYQPLRFYTSDDGARWEPYSGGGYGPDAGGPYSVIGPAAVSYWRGNNIIMYAR